MFMASGAGLSVALIVFGASRLLAMPRERALGRLAELAADGRYVDASEVDLLQDRRASSIPFLDALMRGRNWATETRERLERANLPLKVSEYIALRVLLATLAAFAGVWISVMAGVPAFVLGPVGLFGGFLAPALYVRRRIARRNATLELQLVEMCDVMASMLQSGFGYLQALVATAEQVGPPLSVELTRLIDAMRLGSDAGEALGEMTRRMDSRDWEIIATAIEIQRASGGNLAEILSGVAATIRDRQSLQREVRALTSSERYAAIIIAGFPFVLVGILSVLLWETFGRLVYDPIGRMILVGAIIMDLIGYAVIKRITKVEV